MLDITELPVVQKVLQDAKYKIIELTGLNVNVEVKVLNTDNMQSKLSLIAKHVCDVYNVTLAQLQSSRRTTGNSLVDARHSFMYIAHKVVGYTSKETGRFLNDKDHSTVLYACTKIKDFYKVKDPMILKVNEIIKRLVKDEG